MRLVSFRMTRVSGTCCWPIVNNSVTTNVVKFSLDLQHLVPLLLDPDLPPPRGQMVPPLTANRVLKLNYSLSTWPEVNVLVRALLRPGIFYFKFKRINR